MTNTYLRSCCDFFSLRPISGTRSRGLSPFALILSVSGLLACLSSCGFPAHAPASDPKVERESDDDAVVNAIERRIADTITKIRRSAVALEYTGTDSPSGTRRVATGVVVNDEGDVLSIRIDPPTPSAPIIARDASGKRHRADWIATDPETGLTLLRIKPLIARPVRPATREAQLGSQVLVIGNPFGLGHSVIRGQVAGLDRRVDVGPRPLGGLMQIDAALHPGDSGALVANLHGEWIGLIRSGVAVPGGERIVDHDLGFAIRARDALWIADQLHSRHRVERAYLGVRLNAVAFSEPPGAVLGGVLADSPADRAGLRPGDRVVALDGHAIESPGDLTDRLDRTLANSETTVEFLRGAVRKRFVVQTACRPPFSSSPAPPASEKPERNERPSSPPRETIKQSSHRTPSLEKQTSSTQQP